MSFTEIYNCFHISQIINNLLDDISKINLIQTCKDSYKNKHRLTFNEKYEIFPEDVDKWYFNNLTNIKIHTLTSKLPQNLLKLSLCHGFLFHKDFIQPYPAILNEITLHKFTYLSFRKYIPENVKINCIRFSRFSLFLFI